MPTFLSLPEKASTMAGPVNVLLLTMLVVGFFFVIWIALLAFESMASSEDRDKEEEAASEKDRTVPKWWSLGVGLVILALFVWSSVLYLTMIKVPENAENVISVAKHWVWKFQHAPDGKGEIDELHVAVGQPVRLIMTSQDTVHSIFVPSFMQQQDILPGKFTAMWFTVTKPGEYEFYTTQYSGTGYAKMIGKIIAMEPEAYQAWLSGKPIAPPAGGEELLALGEQLFTDLGCAACHTDQDTPVAPTLHDIYGKEITLADGSTVTVDDAYLHESIVDPHAKLVEGYGESMPATFGDLSEEQLNALIAYIKSLSGVAPEGGGETGGGGDPQRGAEIFTANGCNSCHGDQDSPIAPTLNNVFGHEVMLESGETVVADEAYIIESIVDPAAKVVQGYSPVMPPYPDFSEQDLADLVAYIQSLSAEMPAEGGEEAPAETPESEPTQEAESPAGGLPAGEGDAAAGEQAFMDQGCQACHTDQDTPVAPTVVGIFGKEITLDDGSTVTVDEEYLYESIVDPHAKLVEGYGPVMPPTYSDLDPQVILDIIAYIKSLGQ
jgi:cytochrome c oxidase subunit 2